VAHPFAKYNAKSQIRAGCPTLPRSVRKGGRQESTSELAQVRARSVGAWLYSESDTLNFYTFLTTM
jgi:hypothetical protein